jgi:hypothetical protein
MPMSVNMFALRFFTDTTARTKNGQPPQSTTGALSANWSHAEADGEITARTGCPGIMSAMASTNVGTANTALTQKRRRMSTNSGFSSSVGVHSSGSRAMPHLGHGPGFGSRTSGSMGHTYIVPGLAGAGGAASAGLGERYAFGSALNFARHLGLQK